MPAACPSFLTPPLPASDPGPPLPAPPPRYQVLAPQRLCPPPSPLLPNSNWACPAALPRRLLHRAAPSRPRSEDCATTIARQLTSRDGPFPPAPTRRRRPCGLRRQPPLLGGGRLLGRPARPGQVGQRRRSDAGISGTPCILPLLPCVEGAPRRVASAAAERQPSAGVQKRAGGGVHESAPRHAPASAGSLHPPGRGRDGQGEAPAGFGGRSASPPAPVQSRLRQLLLRTAVTLRSPGRPGRARRCAGTSDSGAAEPARRAGPGRRSGGALKRSSWTVVGPAFTRLCSRRTPDVRPCLILELTGSRVKAGPRPAFSAFLDSRPQRRFTTWITTGITSESPSRAAFLDSGSRRQGGATPRSARGRDVASGDGGGPWPSRRVFGTGALSAAVFETGVLFAFGLAYLRSRRNRRQQQQLRSRPPRARASRPETATRRRVGAHSEGADGTQHHGTLASKMTRSPSNRRGLTQAGRDEHNLRQTRVQAARARDVASERRRPLAQPLRL